MSFIPYRFVFFQQPVWFLLLIPLALVLRLWNAENRTLRYILWLRITLFLFIVLAMTAPMITLPTRSGTVVVLADRSASMPAGTADAQKQTIDILTQNNSPSSENRLEVVAFAEKPVFSSLGGTEIVDTTANDGSDLCAAIESALSLIPVGDKGRLLILSDGRWTGESPLSTVAQLVSRGIAADYRIMERPTVGDIAVLSIEAPDKVLPDEVFRTIAWVHVPTSQNIDYELLQNGVTVEKGTQSLRSGNNHLRFLLKAGKPGALNCELKIKHSDSDAANGQNTVDPVPENNTAKKIVGIEGDKPLLVVAPNDERRPTGSRLADVLNNAGIKTEKSEANSNSANRWSLEFLNRYSGVVLENAPSSMLGVPAMELISEWVKETGTGLMFTGGKNAYALGGYYQSPLDGIMPVSMELRKEHRKLSVAVAIMMDCSGSMGMTVPGGKIKMDLANLGAAEVLKILTPMDEVAVMTCDTGVQTILPLKHNTNPQGDRGRILSTGPGGGGIFVYTALLAASKTLSQAQAGTKHIILFTDADDTEEPREYALLLESVKKVGMTCSVIALGTPADSTAGLCEDIARRGGGNIYYTEQANDLPRLFALDTFTISRQTFLEDPTPFHFTGGMMTLTGMLYETVPNVGGYNLSYIKPGVMPSAVTDDEYKAPLIASWQAGLGRVLCYTGEVDGQFTGGIAKWKDYNSMLASLARWTAGRTNELPNGMMLTQELKDGAGQIRLLLDSEESLNQELSSTPRASLRILKQKSGGVLETETKQLQWLEPDVLGVNVPLTGKEVLQATLLLEGSQQENGTPAVFSLPPICLPYSPEYRPASGQHGVETLKQLAAATGGKERTELTGIWQDIQRVPRYYELTPWFIYGALLLFVAEIIQRRMGLLFDKSLLRKMAAVKKTANQPEHIPDEKSVSMFRKLSMRKEQRKTLHSASVERKPVVQEKAVHPIADSSEVADGAADVFDALQKAKRTSREKM